jgi:hypothetical protein
MAGVNKTFCRYFPKRFIDCPGILPFCPAIAVTYRNILLKPVGILAFCFGFAIIYPGVPLKHDSLLPVEAICSCNSKFLPAPASTFLQIGTGMPCFRAITKSVARTSLKKSATLLCFVRKFSAGGRRLTYFGAICCCRSKL